MDWANIFNPPEGQGTVFWFAAIALAAGASLIVAAIVLQIKRLLAGKNSAVEKKETIGDDAAQDPGGEEPAVPAKAQTLTITDTGYKPSSAGLVEPNEPPPALGDLLKRLRSAASVLEEMAEGIPGQEDQPGGTSEAGSQEKIEFLFKADQNA